MTIHREGYKILISTLIILLVLNLAVIYGLPGNITLHTVVLISSVVVFLMILQFFRSPRRLTPFDANHIIAPADGKVVVIEEVVEEEYFKARRRQISIFMSPINVHVNRSPVDGVVQYFKYHAGKYLVAWHPKSSTENERTTIVIKSQNDVEILFRQIAGALAKRIVWYVKEGQPIQQGAEFGFIKFGSRVDVFIPLDATVTVSIGEKTRGGQTVIAKLNR
jgi:phosphatidylserine decarboxylase